MEPDDEPIRLFAGRPAVLRAFLAVSKSARVFATAPGADILIIPLTDDLQDDIHRVWGTGDWLTAGPRIAAGDMTFAARASQAAPLAYIERFELDDGLEESGILWASGALSLGPLTLHRAAASPTSRPRSLWPINVVLRGLGGGSDEAADEASAFGLGEDVVTLGELVARSREVHI